MTIFLLHADVGFSIPCLNPTVFDVLKIIKNAGYCKDFVSVRGMSLYKLVPVCQCLHVKHYTHIKINHSGFTNATSLLVWYVLNSNLNSFHFF